MSVHGPATETTTRVAFQGERGAYSEEAAERLLGEGVTPVPRPTFESLFAAIGEGAADLALAPLENTLAGSVGRAYDLLAEGALHITGEVVLRVRHCLIGCPGATLDAIKVVESHPVALAQCERFFGARPEVRREASEDTAGSVARIVARGERTRAAIAGRRAAEIYGGAILCEHLEDEAENYTRFVLLSPSAAAPPGDTRLADKLSLVVRLARRTGALHHALDPFARRGIDLLRVESRPVKGHPWQYHFFLDFQISPDDAEASAALDELGGRVVGLRVLGRYPAARTPSARPAPAANPAD